MDLLKLANKVTGGRSHWSCLFQVSTPRISPLIWNQVRIFWKAFLKKKTLVVLTGIYFVVNTKIVNLKIILVHKRVL